MTIISQRVYGPGREITCNLNFFLDLCREQRVGMMTNDSVREYHVLLFDDEERRLIVNRPISSNPRKPGGKESMTVAINDIILIQESPVICHGLKNAAHLNGKVGETRSFDNKTGRYEVRFEDKRLKPTLIKPENLLIAFDLPDYADKK